MPAKTERQRRFFGAELARKRAGKKTRTGLSEKELRKMASKSPPSGVQAFTSNPSASGATPSVPTGYSNLPSSRALSTAPVPPERSRARATGLVSAVARLDSRRNLGNPPQNVRGGPFVKSVAARMSERQPAGVEMFENVPVVE